jgi:hypothetical protein
MATPFQIRPIPDRSRSSSWLPKPSLSPEALAARESLQEAGDIVMDSRVGMFLLRKDALEDYTSLVGIVFKDIQDAKADNVKK